MSRSIARRTLLRVVDVLFVPFTAICAWWMRLLRRIGVQHMRASKAVMLRIGVFPIQDHFYEPLFNPRHLRFPLDRERDLPGIDLNIDGQLSLLDEFSYAQELEQFPDESPRKDKFHYRNGFFGVGDAQFLYSVIRHFRPRRIVEIGSGYSTLMTLHAISANKSDTPDYACDVTCVEPDPKGWLDEMDVNVIRRPVEEIGLDTFSRLQANDICFIDSSHMIRPQGDVPFEYLEVLPRLQPGVLVHVHDIFTPRDYREDWIVNFVRFWNEQYLLEAFLSCNRDFKVLGALNHLYHCHRDALLRIFPKLASQPESTPRCGSFWMVKL